MSYSNSHLQITSNLDKARLLLSSKGLTHGKGYPKKYKGQTLAEMETFICLQSRKHKTPIYLLHEL